VGNKSIVPAISLQTLRGGIVPGQRITQGTRKPPIEPRILPNVSPRLPGSDEPAPFTTDPKVKNPSTKSGFSSGLELFLKELDHGGIVDLGQYRFPVGPFELATTSFSP
jgi:hypothetical protein